MSTGWIAFAALVALVAATLVWAAGRWLARSWELLDDDQLSDKLAGRGHPEVPAAWLRLRGWLAGGPRRLTYRRDRRGRFRRIRH